MKYIVFADQTYSYAPVIVCDTQAAIQSAVLELIDDHDIDEGDVNVYELGRKGQWSRSITVNFGDPI